MIVSHNNADLFKIVSRNDPDLAVTAYGSADGTSGGTTSTSAGNIFVSEFTGAANQLWKTESGGQSIGLSNNIKVTSQDLPGGYYVKQKANGIYNDRHTALGYGELLPRDGAFHALPRCSRGGRRAL